MVPTSHEHKGKNDILNEHDFQSTMDHRIGVFLAQCCVPGFICAISSIKLVTVLVQTGNGFCPWPGESVRLPCVLVLHPMVCMIIKNVLLKFMQKATKKLTAYLCVTAFMRIAQIQV